MEVDKRLVLVAGLPRAGSTLVCQLLGEHPEIFSTSHSSPLIGALEDTRRNLSDSDFYLSQLDANFDLAYARFGNALRGFINGWFEEADTPVVVDKNRNWLRMIETLRELAPNFRMIICIRELTQVFGSIEAQHARTRLINFPDHIDAHNLYNRADTLFSKGGLIGRHLKAIQYVTEIKDEEMNRNIYFAPFEHIVNDVVNSMNTLFEWIGVERHNVDSQNLTVCTHESDSYYRFKYRHRTYRTITPPHLHRIPPRLAGNIRNQFKWYYDDYYPDAITTPVQS